MVTIGFVIAIIYLLGKDSRLPPFKMTSPAPGISRSRSRKSGSGPGTRLLIKSGTETGTQIQNLRDSGPELGLCIFLFGTKIFYKSWLCPGYFEG